MAKVNYTKVEEELISLQRQSFIDDLNELAAIAELKSGRGHTKISEHEIFQIFIRFQNELRFLKDKDPHFFSTLNINSQVEKKLLMNDHRQLAIEDWTTILVLKERIDKWKKQLKKAHQLPEGQDLTAEVEEARKKQKDARFNVNPKWRPL